MNPRKQIWIFRVAIFLSAFLLFSIQPMIAKILLPWFGGSSTVWTLCLVFFTSSLLLGYLYAHLLSRWSLRTQRIVHGLCSLVVVGLVVALWHAWGSPLSPSAFFKPDPSAPIGSLFFLLLLTIGGPYLLLSATTPLIQSWFHLTFDGTPYKLYSVSNIGSLGALLSYPLLIEPFLAVSTQGRLWASGLFVFVGVLLWAGQIVAQSKNKQALETVSSQKAVSTPWSERGMWTVLSAVPSFFLVVVTTNLTQGIASAPFLWVLPLSLYLLTFIIVFSDFKLPRAFLQALLIVSLAFSMMVLSDQVHATLLELTGALAPMFFFVCLLFHQWVFELRPEPHRLTTYYVSTSLGGALGTVLASLLVPLVFVRPIELVLSVIVLLVLTCILFLRSTTFLVQRPVLGRALISFLVLSVSLFTYKFVMQTNPDSVFEARNFYGTLSVTDEVKDGTAVRLLNNGRIVHGMQFAEEAKRYTPTTYYVETSGVGQEIRFLQSQQPSQRLGLVGLGSGALAGYCRPSDDYHFFEIDPDVITIANEQFSFLNYCDGSRVTLGDARLSLEEEQIQNAQPYDVLVVDAFTDDSIPVHLLTKEAFALYLNRLTPGGVLAVHISNRFLKLAPVVKGSAESFGLNGVVVSDIETTNSRFEGSVWVLLSKDPVVFPATFTGNSMSLDEVGDPVYWTDAFSNLLSVVRF